MEVDCKKYFYVYVYLDPRKKKLSTYEGFTFDYEPFYVGKGSGNRLTVHLECLNKNTNIPRHNKIRKIVKETNVKPIVLKVKDCLTERQAFVLEKKLIKIIGRKDLKKGTLVNLTDGGEGTSNYTGLKQIKFEGESKTLTQWARVLKINIGTLSMRLNNYGWSVRQSFTTPSYANLTYEQRIITQNKRGSRKKSKVVLKFRGEKKTLDVWSAETGLSTQTIIKRLRNNWTIREALTRSIEDGLKIGGSNKAKRIKLTHIKTKKIKYFESAIKAASHFGYSRSYIPVCIRKNILVSGEYEVCYG